MTQEMFLVANYGVPDLGLCREGFEYVVCPTCGSHIMLEREIVDDWFDIQDGRWEPGDAYEQMTFELWTECDWDDCSDYFGCIVRRPDADERHSSWW